MRSWPGSKSVMLSIPSWQARINEMVRASAAGKRVASLAAGDGTSSPAVPISVSRPACH